MVFIRRCEMKPARLGVFPGSFNPVTVAHLALATASLNIVDEVVFVLPQEFPHKKYSGASFSQRLEVLQLATREFPRFSIASAAGGLFLEIAAECRQAYGSEVRQSFLCGRDAAERIVNWDYGRPGALQEMLSQFDFLVAGRHGEYAAPDKVGPDYSGAFQRLDLCGDYDPVSASEVRERIAQGLPWEHLVPPAIGRKVGEIYAPIERRRN
jgi:nicotinate-nucleotide adenylyltransferase